MNAFLVCASALLDLYHTIPLEANGQVSRLWEVHNMLLLMYNNGNHPQVKMVNIVTYCMSVNLTGWLSQIGDKQKSSFFSLDPMVYYHCKPPADISN